MKRIKFQGKNIEYVVKGSGKTIVFLHGYIESLNVWDDFAQELSKNYKTIAIDLPGHGNSEVIKESHSMALMAEAVNSVLIAENIEKCTLIGHSMGGYVTMQFLEMYPEKLEAACLFHSTPFDDDEDRKKIRDQIIVAIKAGKKILLAKEHVEKTFAPQNLSKYSKEIGFLKIIAVNTSNEGTIAALDGMKNRKNHSATFNNSVIPLLWILGAEDNFIPIEVKDKVKLPQKSEVIVLQNSGHQGFIEEFDNSIKIIKQFVK
ncbi:MAG: alpha/beta hydrolase [Bacteroidales bacterium]|nr:alpha/beta hydrolase [Bacteroidales bacterium]